MSEKIRESFNSVFKKVKENLEMNETKLRRIFDKHEILESLKYKERDISVEANIEGKKADYHCKDDYENVVVIWELKKPSEKNLSKYRSQLWDLYVKPLRAEYGVLFNGLQIILYRRIDSNYEEIFRGNALDLSDERIRKLEQLEKPEHSIIKLKEIKEYFGKFGPEEEKITLEEESSRKHFFKIFRLTKGSVFENLISRMLKLFEKEYESKKKSKFLTSAYDFWKEAYANEPEEVPKQWGGVMERLGLDSSKKEDLFKFMFCIETSYALFTRLILAKACEDYKFPGVEFSGFIERGVKDFSFRGKEISRPAWAIMAKQLIERMKDQLVESIFEEDIFYWWISAFKEIEEDIKSGPYSSKADRATVLFGGAVAKTLFAVYKFDFSKIIGDPLGNLYQRYFDKKTRKALGEFYTPQEVVDYIIDAVNYEGHKILSKRLLDPACGSGTFLVTALNKYLSEAENRVKNSSSWRRELKKLCNEYHIVGFDIHPFATIMAQIQFMLVLLKPYKKALEEDPRFVLNRIPIFRTDSLINERKSGKVTLEYFGNSEIQSIKIPLKLPIYEEEGGKFVTIELVLPYKEAVIKHEVDILNTEEYFKTLQALFDTVKKRAKSENYTLDKEEFETNLKHYLENKNWSQIANFLELYGNDLLQKIKKLKYEYGDGRLVKSIEDLLLASILKNYVKYEYVVGNPPYVRGEALPKTEKEGFRKNYPKIYHGNNDLYVYFLQRGINWLRKNGKFGYIVSGKFTKTDYGGYIRASIMENTSIDEFIDMRTSKVFADVTNDPCILILTKQAIEGKTSIVKVKKDFNEKNWKDNLRNLLHHIVENKERDFRGEYIDSFSSAENVLGNIKKVGKKVTSDEWTLIREEESKLMERIESKSAYLLDDITVDIETGVQTGKDKIFILSEKEVESKNLEKGILKRFISGEDVRRWEISYNNRFLIYPYKLVQNETTLISEKKLKENYPHIYKYLKLNKENLEKRWGVDIWYELPTKRDIEWFKKKKILTPDISSRSNFAVDEEGFYFTKKPVYGIELKKDFEDKLTFILALLNSKVLEWYYKQIATYLGAKGYRYQRNYLQKLPIFIPKPSSRKTQVTSIRNKIGKIREIKKYEEKLDDFPYVYFDSQELSKKSIRISFSHTSIFPQIQKRQDGAYSVIIGNRKKEKPIVVNTKEKARFVKLAFEGKPVKKNQKVKVLLPKSNSDVKEILEEYKKDKKKLEGMPSVEELEEEVNQIVYDLYGLSGEDIKMIEDFLEKF